MCISWKSGRKTIIVFSLLFQIIFIWVGSLVSYIMGDAALEIIGYSFMIGSNISYRLGEVFYLTIAETLPPLGISICFGVMMLSRNLICYVIYIIMNSQEIPEWPNIAIFTTCLYILL